MENKRKYYNRATLVNAKREIKGDYKLLKMVFKVRDPEANEDVTKFFSMFLTQDSNDRNRETLQRLGVEKPPEAVTYDTVQSLEGLGTRVVDLVEEKNGEYNNIKYINRPNFGVKVYDMKPKTPF